MNSEYGHKKNTSPLAAASYEYLAEMYNDFKAGKSNIPDFWREYFASNYLEEHAIDYAPIRDKFKTLAKMPVTREEGRSSNHESINSLRAAYREYGYIKANINPLFKNDLNCEALNLINHGFTSENDRVGSSSLKDVINELEKYYCNTASLETSHMSNLSERDWLYDKMEHNNVLEDAEVQRKILENLSRAEGIESYFALKYVGQKRFSLEGGESLIPGLMLMLEHASCNHDVTDAVIGMAHRGRLNVMLNIMAMPAEEIFCEFEGRADYGNTSGDVKYHLGYSSDIKFSDNNLHLSLMFNPSHLEFIGPVVNGSARARQDLLIPEKKAEVLPIIIHGDAAMIGQGVVAETFNMSKVPAFDVAGSLHVVINNQVGFTATAKDYMSSEYCTGIAKSINAPIFHVNGDDPEAVVRVMNIALDYRTKFGKDVVVDLVCYRRLGHNEADEPMATLPSMYDIIKKHPTTRTIYAEKLIGQGVVNHSEVSAMQTQVKDTMDHGGVLINGVADHKTTQRREAWNKFFDTDWEQAIETGINIKSLKEHAKDIVHIPDNFKLQRQVSQMIQARNKMADGELDLNWGMAEMLAYSSLLGLGFKVRIVGQDARRGTFSHRHAVLFNQNNGEAYNTLEHITPENDFFIYDSVLSETAPLGYEYGYSITNSNCLNIWEAQFGDFANGAQVIIDQFISSGCQKWKRLSGLVLLLPHGYEGMGPEHSSARLERFLQLSAQQNIQVCVPSTPAQMFHLLLRQMMRQYRKPLIVMTPKSLLRNPDATSKLDELKKGRFEVVIQDSDDIKPNKVSRVILCSGKVYYELLKKRTELGLSNVAIIRLEQLYPFPYKVLSLVLSRYNKVQNWVWCQEEPQNQGAWLVVKSNIESCLHQDAALVYAGRESSAAPAAGYPSLHKRKQYDLVNQAFGLVSELNEG